MMKTRQVVIFLIGILMVSFLSCTYSENNSFEYDKKTLTIKYNDTYYYSYAPYASFFSYDGELKKLDTLWGIEGKYDYYVDSIESPTFILGKESELPRGIWFLDENMDIESQTFNIEGSDILIKYSDCYDKSDCIEYTLSNEYKIATLKLYLENTPNLYNSAAIYKINSQYYIKPNYISYKCTEHFVDLLRDAGIIR